MVIHQFLKKVLISENIAKYRFGASIVGFNKVLITQQLVYFLKEQYVKTPTEVTAAKNSDGLSGMDKMEMNLQKIDEGLVVFAEINVASEIERIEKDNDFSITDEEVDYYFKNHHPTKLQTQLVFSYWGKYFGSYRNVRLVSKRQYIKLMLILKKKLMILMGDEEEGVFSEYARLPYILSGNMKDKLNTRIIRNNKFISKIESSYLYEKLITEKYRNLCDIKNDYILSLLSQLINTTFTYVVYERPDLLGTEIEYNEDKISDELLFFLNLI